MGGKKRRGRRHYRRARERNISIRGVRRHPPDLKKLSQALVALALARAEAEAQAEHDERARADLPEAPDGDPEDAKP